MAIATVPLIVSACTVGNTPGFDDFKARKFPSPEEQRRPAETPTPAPTLVLPAVVTELRNAGIEIEVQNDIDSNAAPSFPERLTRFWPVLERTKELIVARKAWILKIKVGDFTSYDSTMRCLTIGVSLTDSDFENYWRYFDRRLEWESRSGIKVNFGIEVFGFEAEKFRGLAEKLDFLESKTEEFTRVGPALRYLEFTRASEYDPKERRLKIRSSLFRRTINAALPHLAASAPFFEFAQSKNLEIGGESFPSHDLDQLGLVTRELMSKESDLVRLEKLKVLRQIELKQDEDQIRLMTETGLLVVPFDNQELANVVEALADQHELSSLLKLPIDSELALGKDYAEAVRRMMSRSTTIRRKAAKLDRISLARDTSYAGRTLKIGCRGPVSELDRILDLLKEP